MDIQSNRDKLYDYAKNSVIFGKLSMQGNAELVMFYCSSILKENIYYIKSLDIIVVATFKDSRLHLLDIFGMVKIELDKVIYALVNSQIVEVTLGFTPEDCSDYKVREIAGADVLFIQKDKVNLFEENKLMFPLLSHA
jgi:hypothetical protein